MAGGSRDGMSTQQSFPRLQRPSFLLLPSQGRMLSVEASSGTNGPLRHAKLGLKTLQFVLDIWGMGERRHSLLPCQQRKVATQDVKRLLKNAWRQDNVQQK